MARTIPVNNNYPAGTEFEVTMRIKTDFIYTDEAEIIAEFFRWHNATDGEADMHICPGSIRVTLHKKGNE